MGDSTTLGGTWREEAATSTLMGGLLSTVFICFKIIFILIGF